jgi:Tol biopolymer transport system component
MHRISVLAATAIALTLPRLTASTPLETLQQTDIPLLFFPESVSTGIDKFNTSFDKEELTVYYTATSRSMGVSGIAYQTWEGESFGDPVFVDFVDPKVPVADVQISPDGQQLFYATFKDYPGKAEGFHFDIWMATKKDNNWVNPGPAPSAIQSAGNEFYPIMVANGSLYFNSDRNGNSDLYVSHFLDGRYQEPVRLPDAINTEATEADAYVAPDESFIIFVRVDAPGGLGNSDLYISFNLGEGKWSEARHMGERINSSGIDGSPHVSNDGQWLIFTSDRKPPTDTTDVFESYAHFRKYASGYRNGSLNFFYVSLNAEQYR